LGVNAGADVLIIQKVKKKKKNPGLVNSEIYGTGNVEPIIGVPLLPKLLVSFSAGYKGDTTNSPLKLT
jgi:hypothetical protein